MKSTIEGFNQEYALSLRKTAPAKGGGEKLIKIDCTDLVILRWLVDFYPSMRKMYVEGREYVWLTHNKLREDIPLLDISRKACVERMHKLVEFGILEYKLVKSGGTFSLYTLGPNYINLVQSTPAEGVRSTDHRVVGQPDRGCAVNQPPGGGSTDYRVVGQPDNKDKSIKDISIKDNIKYIVEYLNQKAEKEFRTGSKETQSHINARLSEGYTLEDFKTVIDKKCTEWKGTTFDQYLRPATLFGTKFESYLNAQAVTPAQPRPATVGPNGIAIDPSKNDLDAFFK